MHNEVDRPARSDDKSSAVLDIAEMFFSLQGEGRNGGRPAVFLRLQALQSPLWTAKSQLAMRHTRGLAAGDTLHSLALLTAWEERGWLQLLANSTLLVVTGGEPLLQQESLLAFLQLLTSRLGKQPHVEIETNATLIPTTDLTHR